MFQRAYVSGATSGIGEALANLLAEKGIPLLLTGRDAGRLQKIKDRLSSKVEVVTFLADLSTKEGRGEVVSQIRHFTPDLVVNNAGFGLYGFALDLPVEKQMEVVEVDALAVMEITLEAAHALKGEKKKGVILNISSAAAYQVFPCFSSYAASKAFVNSLSQSLDFEMQKEGIRILTACPGQVETRFSLRASGKEVKVDRGGLVMDVKYAADRLWDQIQNGQRVVVFDWRYRILTLISRILPVSFVGNLLVKVLSRRIKSEQR